MKKLFTTAATLIAILTLTTASPAEAQVTKAPKGCCWYGGSLSVVGKVPYVYSGPGTFA